MKDELEVSKIQKATWARSILANSPRVPSVISIPGAPRAPDCWDWEDIPTLIVFSYWA